MTAAAIPTPADALWDFLRTLVNAALNLFGGPEEIAAQRVLDRATYRRLSQWLAPLEAMARRLLFAAAMAFPAPKKILRRRKQKRASAVARAFDPDAPSQAWPTSLRFTRFRIAARGKARPAAPALRLAAPLAARLEMLARIALDPQRYAKRLAARARRSLAVRDAVLTAPPHFKVNPAGDALHECHTLARKAAIADTG
ncbi:MAG: hypothetical protein GC189_10470 [Alphaproteobacteria bacterium]|nr:hypothetical protein [Alphaproteobacteria bacterium]